ncbi:MAG: hypothetical protein KME11_12470 [Timaviella obliquedivisa GSE-PSE-MK23-08B]|jgi:hypothetical protein|nr:hypothetical protein [Timaviella obliquedivisa GSE-PSE-MK23-08B]
MTKQQRYEKRQAQPKIAPRRISYSIADSDVWGIEFDAKFRGEEVYSRLFFIPTSDSLYCWMTDRRPEQFVQIPMRSISAKRKTALLQVWQGQPTEQKVTA